MNKAVLVGRLTKDPELRYAAGSGIATSRFTVAVNRQGKKDEADFINCVAFNKTAETIANYLVKGRQIAISGHIQTGSYLKDDGTKVYTTESDGWITEYREEVCSECGEGQIGISNYCPNCGAKMDLEEEDK